MPEKRAAMVKTDNLVRTLLANNVSKAAAYVSPANFLAHLLVGPLLPLVGIPQRASRNRRATLL